MISFIKNLYHSHFGDKYFELVDILIKARADVNATDQNDKTALKYFIEKIDRYHNGREQEAIKTIKILFNIRS